MVKFGMWTLFSDIACSFAPSTSEAQDDGDVEAKRSVFFFFFFEFVTVASLHFPTPLPVSSAFVGVVIDARLKRLNPTHPVASLRLIRSLRTAWHHKDVPRVSTIIDVGGPIIVVLGANQHNVVTVDHPVTEWCKQMKGNACKVGIQFCHP